MQPLPSGLVQTLKPYKTSKTLQNPYSRLHGAPTQARQPAAISQRITPKE